MYVCIPIVFSKFFGDTDKDSYYTKRSAASRPDRTLQSSNDDSFRSNFFMYSFILIYFSHLHVTVCLYMLYRVFQNCRQNFTEHDKICDTE
jgi:hypothetical protein